MRSAGLRWCRYLPASSRRRRGPGLSHRRDGGAVRRGLDPLSGVWDGGLLGADRLAGGRGDNRHSCLLLAYGSVWNLDAGLGGVRLPDDGGVWSGGDNLLGLGGGIRLGHVPSLSGVVGHWVVDGLGLVVFGGLLPNGTLSAELGGARGCAFLFTPATATRSGEGRGSGEKADDDLGKHLDEWSWYVV